MVFCFFPTFEHLSLQKAFSVVECCSLCSDRAAVQMDSLIRFGRLIGLCFSVEPKTLIELNNLGRVNAADEKFK